MLSYYVIYYETFKNVMQRTEKEALVQTNPYCYTNMVNSSRPATFCIHKKEFAAKTVAGSSASMKLLRNTF